MKRYSFTVIISREIKQNRRSDVLSINIFRSTIFFFFNSLKLSKQRRFGNRDFKKKKQKSVNDTQKYVKNLRSQNAE